MRNPSPPAPLPEYRARGARSKDVGKDEGVSPWNIENTTRSPEGTKGTRAFALPPFAPSGLRGSPRCSCYRIHGLAPMATSIRPFGTRSIRINAQEWSRIVKDFGRTFKNVAGKPTRFEQGTLYLRYDYQLPVAAWAIVLWLLHFAGGIASGGLAVSFRRVSSSTR